MNKAAPLRAVAVWAAPVAIALVTALGLALALLFEGVIAKASACIALATPLAVIIYHGARATYGRHSTG